MKKIHTYFLGLFLLITSLEAMGTVGVCSQNTLLFQNSTVDNDVIYIHSAHGDINPNFSDTAYRNDFKTYTIGTIKECSFQCEITLRYRTQHNEDCMVTLFLTQHKRSCTSHLVMNTGENCKAEVYAAGGAGGGPLLLRILK